MCLLYEFGLISPLRRQLVGGPGYKTITLKEDVYERLVQLADSMGKVSISDAVRILLTVYDNCVKERGGAVPKPGQSPSPALETKPISVDLKNNDDDYVRRYVEDLRRRLGLA
jgi:hypothetical protein